jgi:hypothetical protein
MSNAINDKINKIEYRGSDGNIYSVRIAFESGQTPSHPDEVEVFYGSHKIVGASRDSYHTLSRLQANKYYRVYLSAGGGEKGAIAVAKMLDDQGALRSPFIEEDEDDEEDEELEDEEEEVRA